MAIGYQFPPECCACNRAPGEKRLKVQRVSSSRGGGTVATTTTTVEVPICAACYGEMTTLSKRLLIGFVAAMAIGLGLIAYHPDVNWNNLHWATQGAFAAFGAGIVLECAGLYIGRKRYLEVVGQGSTPEDLVFMNISYQRKFESLNPGGRSHYIWDGKL